MLAINADTLHIEHTHSRPRVHSMLDGHSRPVVGEVIALLDKLALVQVPPAAQWLQQYYTAPTEGTIPMGSGEEDSKDEEAECATPSKQEQFKQAVKADKEGAEPKPPQVMRRPADNTIATAYWCLLKVTMMSIHTCCLCMPTWVPYKLPNLVMNLPKPGRGQ